MRSLVIFAVLVSFSDAKVSDYFREPTSLMPGLCLGTWEECLELTRPLSPEAVTWPGERWLRFNVPDAAPGKPNRVTFGWEEYTCPNNADCRRPRRLLLEFNWKGTNFAGKTAKQFKKLGLKRNKFPGDKILRLEGGCPLHGLALPNGYVGWVLVEKGDVVAVLDDSRKLEICHSVDLSIAVRGGGGPG